MDVRSVISSKMPRLCDTEKSDFPMPMDFSVRGWAGNLLVFRGYMVTGYWFVERL